MIKCITAIVCHCNRVAKDSSVLLKKKCMSLGSWRLCPRLRSTRPPSSWAQLLKLVVIGRGSFLSLKNVCNPTATREEEDATLDPTRTVGRAPLVGSWITMPPDAGVGVLREVSPDSLGGWLAVRCLFRVRVARGGWFLPCVCCCYVIGPVPSRIRSIVIVLRGVYWLNFCLICWLSFSSGLLNRSMSGATLEDRVCWGVSHRY